MLSEEQKKERMLGIGGSDAAAVVGVSRYMTPLDLYLTKTGQRELDDETNESIEWGHELEPVVSAKYAQKMGVEIEKPQQAIVHPEYYWMRCNLDFVVKGTTIVGECKTAGFLNEEWGEELTDNIPTPYLLQCAHNAIVSEPFYNTTRVDIPVFTGGKGGLRHRVYTYHRNKELERILIEKERVFWQENVEKMIPPLPKTRNEAAFLWPEQEGKVVVADADALAIVDALGKISEQYKKLKTLEEQQELKLLEIMKDASILADDQGKKLYTWKTQVSKRLDSKTLKSQRPEIYNEFLKESTTRVLRRAKA
jgi:putative phage-type endonuclease